MRRNHFVVPADPPQGPPLLMGLLLLFIAPPFGTIAGAYMLFKRGKSAYRRSKLRDYRQYAAIIGDRSSVSIVEIANRLGKTVGEVTMDLAEMIRQNMIDPRSRIDRASNILYLQDDVFETQFVNNTVNIYNHVPEEVPSKAPKRAAKPKSAPQAAKPEPAGEPEPKAETKPREPRKKAEPAPMSSDYFEAKLKEIRQLNEDIANEVVSERIDRIGALTASIFRVVQEKPERTEEVRKFMNYYLPTTLKLLKSYSLMEKQSYQGENIAASRKKIEDVLNTLVHAFEQQQDKLFQSDALDVETDISVLETMMASDGLTEPGKGLHL